MAEAPVYLLDTSAFFTFTDGEPGADVVKKLLLDAQSGRVKIIASTISLMEIYYVALQEMGSDEAAKLLGLIKSFAIGWIAPSEKLLLQAALLKARYRMSVADAIVAATAKLHHATLIHKDRELDALKDQIEMERLPSK